MDTIQYLQEPVSNSRGHRPNPKCASRGRGGGGGGVLLSHLHETRCFIWFKSSVHINYISLMSLSKKDWICFC